MPTTHASPRSSFTSGGPRRSVCGLNQPPEMRKSGRIVFRAGYQQGMVRRGYGAIKHLTTEQLRAILRVIPKENLRDRLLINLMYLHGLRRGEAANLTLDCFQDD